uniref:Putative transmembrane protein n=1 Tax=Toxoplasma gondii COUG TaxID=1074873 RepID=A0A2G8YBW3_TOXGO|nr:putative transmembrane protein [Toxoplasma gondii COUG]
MHPAAPPRCLQFFMAFSSPGGSLGFTASFSLTLRPQRTPKTRVQAAKLDSVIFPPQQIAGNRSFCRADSGCRREARKHRGGT